MRLSIVTIHLEDFSGLKRTLDSLEPHLSDPRVEWILVDGGSRCESRSDELILAEALEKCAFGVAEGDEGIYDAMNKGTRMAKGDYVLYLNAGDELHGTINFDRLASEALGSQADMVWGRCEVWYPDGSSIVTKPRPRSMAWYGLPAPHQATLFRRELIKSGSYDKDYRLASDYELVCRLLRNGARIHVTKDIIANFYRGGRTDSQSALSIAEENEIRLRYFKVPRVASKLVVKFKLLSRGSPVLSRLVRFCRPWL